MVSFPSQLREAIHVVSPLTKMCCKIIAMFPISGTTPKSWRKFPFAAAQLQDHLCTNHLHEEFQSVYRAQHRNSFAACKD